MNLDNEFDELARRKLQERSFPFEEAHWQQVQQSLAAQRGRNRGGIWVLGAAALLLVGIAGWWMLRPTGASGPLTSTEVAAKKDRPSTQDGEVGSTGELSTPSRSSAFPSSPTPETTGNTTTNSTDLHSTRIATAAQQATTPARTMTSNVVGSSDDRHLVQEGRTALYTGPHRSGLVVAAGGTSSTSTTTVGEPGTRPNAALPPIGITPLAPVTNPVEIVANVSDPLPAQPLANAEPTTEAFNGPAQRSDSTSGTAYLAIGDTAARTTPTDSTLVGATVVAPLVPPLIPDQAPWEISLLGGAFSSTATYSGGNSAEWSDDVDRETGPGFGAELMHMGRHIGFGTGLHYGTYAERIQANAVDRTDMNYTNYWYLTQVDTTILIITDTIEQAGQVMYQGMQVNTTISVPTMVTDSTETTTRVRDARQWVNRTSYLEVPLLFDAHLVQGRWSLGLRGGPTVGFLTGRTGSLPSSTNDGYTELGDQAFREVVFGWTARAYLRYRWNAAWSVGIEPAARGLLSNSLSDGAIQRRPSAYGGMISLSYRLR